jgi:hypothetical protein
MSNYSIKNHKKQHYQNYFEIAQKTAILIKDGISKLEDGYKETSFWGILCKELYSKYKLNEAKRLKMDYSRNKNSYRTMVQEIINNDNTEFCKMTYSIAEWQELVQEHMFSNNKGFKQKFAEILSYKLQNERGINCCFKFVYNYFHKVKANTKGKPIWSGEFACIENTKCHSKLKVNAFKFDNSVELMVQMNLEIGIHGEKVLKDLRISGANRENQAILLSANGITNTKSENIHHNSSISNPGLY